MSESKKIITHKWQPSADPIVAAFEVRAQEELKQHLESKSTCIGKGSYSEAHQLGDQGFVCITPIPGKEQLPSVSGEKLVAPFLQYFIFEKDKTKASSKGMPLYGYLDNLKKNGKNLTDENALDAALQILMGLYFLHKNNRAHLDLKSENILVLKVDPIVIQIIDIPINKLTGVNQIDTEYTITTSEHILPAEAITYKYNKKKNSYDIVFDFDYIRKHPHHIDWSAFYVILDELIQVSPKSWLGASCLDKISNKAKKSTEKVCLKDFDAKAWGFKKGRFGGIAEDKKKNKEEEAFNPKCRELIARYQDTLKELEPGVYYNSELLDNPLNTAPMEIQHIVHDYELLKERVSQLFDKENFPLEGAGYLLRQIKTRNEDLNKSLAKCTSTPKVFYELQLKLVATKFPAFSQDLNNFIDEVLSLMKKIMQLHPNHEAIKNLEENILILEKNLLKELSDVKEPKSAILEKLLELQEFFKPLQKKKHEIFLSLTNIIKKFASLDHPIKERCIEILNSMYSTWFDVRPAGARSSKVVGCVSFFGDDRKPNDKKFEKIIEVFEDDEVAAEVKEKKGLVMVF